MKGFAVLFFLAPFGFLQAEADLGHIKPHHVARPVEPKHTALEWSNIMAAQKPSPEELSEFKNGTNPQPDFAGKVHVPDSSLRITNGYTAYRGQFPWQVHLTIDDTSFCGGSLISSQRILTAAHCAGSTYHVRLGAIHLGIREPDSLEVTSRDSIKHRNFDQNTLSNDIAVVHLPSPVVFTTYISPIRLPSHAQQGYSFSGQRLRASGWGKISDISDITPSQLQFADFTAITNNECARVLGNRVISSTLCVATYGGQSACYGDSGGPLICYERDGLFTLVGIVSFGSPSGCQRGYPAAFTRVTSYLNWIESHTGIIIADRH